MIFLLGVLVLILMFVRRTKAYGSKLFEHETYFLLESNCCVHTFFKLKEWSHSINLTTFGHHMFICIFEKIIKCKYGCSIKRMNLFSSLDEHTTIIVFWSYGRKYFMFFFKKIPNQLWPLTLWWCFNQHLFFVFQSKLFYSNNTNRANITKQFRKYGANYR